MRKIKNPHVLLAASAAGIVVYIISKRASDVLKPTKKNPNVAGDSTGGCR